MNYLDDEDALSSKNFMHVVSIPITHPIPRHIIDLGNPTGNVQCVPPSKKSRIIKLYYNIYLCQTFFQNTRILFSVY